jgi:DNA-binding transcriptional LysR family regulator
LIDYRNSRLEFARLQGPGPGSLSVLFSGSFSCGHAAFDELRQGVKDIEFLANPGVGEVRIGSTAPLAASFVSTVIDRLHRRYPGMVFHGATADFGSLQRGLEERQFDLVIVRKIGHG